MHRRLQKIQSLSGATIGESMNVTLEKIKKNEIHVAESLALLLSDTYVLYVKTQGFHWNITGARFYQLHLFFEAQYKELAEAIDEIAEQLRVLKRWAPGSMNEFLSIATLKESSGHLSENDMLKELYDDHTSLKNWLVQWIETAQKCGDEGAADLFIKRLRAHEKAAWMIASHLEIS